MTVEIPLHSRKYTGLVAIVDDEDAELVEGYSWCQFKAKKTFYATARVPGSGDPGQMILMHRLIRADVTGGIDHRDRDGLNNRRSNLRAASQSQQNANQARKTNNTSGYTGVTWDEQHEAWKSQIGVNRKTHSLGLYDDPVEAAMVRDFAARQAFGEFASLNFPNSYAA